MNRRVDGIISELRQVRSALWHNASDPRRRKTGLQSLVSGAMHIAQSPSAPTDPTMWEETVNGAMRQIEAGQAAESSGIEALAWYRSFHSDQSQWGIYIPLSSLLIIDELYLSDVPLDQPGRLQLAWDALLIHERAHFAVDLACAWFELLLRAPVRAESAQRMAMMDFHGHKPSQAWLEIEEAAANALMLRRLRADERVGIEAVERFVSVQPAGYREGLSAASDDAFAEVMRETVRSHLGPWAMERGLDLGSPSLDLLSVIPFLSDHVLQECPVYEINDLAECGFGEDGLHRVTRIEAVTETKAFLKRYRKLDEKYRRDWENLKEQIAHAVPTPPRFERLKDRDPPVWSLYLQNGHRVHLRSPTEPGCPWVAFKVGGHKEMGHG